MFFTGPLQMLKSPLTTMLFLEYCNLHLQIVKVQLREGITSEDSLVLPSEGVQTLNAVPATPMPSMPFVSVATPVHPSVKSLSHSKTLTQQLAFDATPIDKTSGWLW